TILRSNAQVRLNAQQALRGLELKTPAKIECIQRRKHYRVGVSGLKLADIELARPHDGHDDRCSINGRIGPGRIINISAGGMTLLFDISVLKRAKIGERFFGTLTIPGHPEALHLLLEARHARNIVSSESLLVGFAFRPWVGMEFRHAQRTLTRVVTELERKLLQRTH
ncbi:MAG: hypothetical protein ACE5E5_15000, partial [Phycisphaerae bacterium]